MSDSICRHLRTKTLYVPAQTVESDEARESETARHCWCNKTMTPVGLDDRRVNVEACSDPGRSCHRPG
ncbi:hypothetical protein [Congregicoccus parvus]|jgi:hypothetical protein|uniref:hypothetical protein n=1 Tax=Congregicoccus parvus TaxID=3081749 RepID=UPI003FA55B01